MSIGRILASVRLDQPGLIHCGSGEPVAGVVLVKFSPGASDTDLFGPLKLVVHFHGRAKSKVWKSNGNSTHIYRGRAQLFSQYVKIYDDSFRSAPNKTHSFPFSLTFPETTQGGRYGETGSWEADPRFVCDPGDPLPPSFIGNYRGFGHHYESFVEYRVGVVATVPGIDVRIATHDKYEEPVVLYEQPRAPPSGSNPAAGFDRYVSVKNELLLPEEDRPHGFRQKAKAALSSDAYPTYAFDWHCTAPRHLYVGRAASFELRIKPRERECTAILIPEVKLVRFTAEIVADTEVRAEKQLFRCPDSHSDSSMAFLQGKMDRGGPFSKAEDWTKTVSTQQLENFTSTFQTYNICLSHTMELTVVFSVAGKEKSEKLKYAIVVHSPTQASTASAGPSTGESSSQPLDMSNMASALPQYDRPPEYDEATFDAPPSMPKDKQSTLVHSGLR